MLRLTVSGKIYMQRIAVVLSAVLCLSAVIGCNSPGRAYAFDGNFDPENLEELSEERADFSKALALFSQGYSHELKENFEESIGYYLRALEFDPGYHELYLRTALHHIRLDQLDKAEEIMETLASREPSLPQAHVWQAFVYRAGDKPDKAIESYRKALDLAPHDADPYIQLADLYLKQGETDKAQQTLIEGIDKAEDTNHLLSMLGDLYLGQSEEAANYEEAEEYQKKAIDLFKQALEKDPENPALLHSLARLYLLNNRIDDAIPLLEKLSGLRPEDLRLKIQLADAYIAKGKLHDAIDILEDIVEYYPTNARIYLRLGELYRSIDDRENAIINFRLAAKAEHPEPAIYLNLALLQMEDNPEKAAESLHAGLEVLPDHPRMVELMAYVYYEIQDHENALTYFEQAENLFTKDGDEGPAPNFHLFYALSLQEHGDIEQAAGMLALAIEKNPVALDGYAHNALQDGTREFRLDAIGILNSIKERFPDNPSISIYLGYLHSYEEEYDKAISAFDTAVDKAGESGKEEFLDASFYFWYAAAHEREGDIRTAEELFYECLERDPDNAEAYNYLAYMWAEKGINLDQAYEYVLIALDQKPDSGAFVDTLGWIYYMQGEYSKAYDEIRRAAELMPDDPTILDHLGDVYFKLDNTAKAMDKWKQSFIIDPDNEDVKKKLKNHGVDIAPLLEKAEEDDNENADNDGMPDDGHTSPDSMEIRQGEDDNADHSVTNNS